MANTIQVDVVSAEELIFSGPAEFVVLPGVVGELGILPGHTPLLTTLTVGQAWYRKGSEKHYFSVANGFAEVLPDRVRLLAMIAERADEIDIARAEDEKKRAEELIAAARSGNADIDLERARVSLMKAMIRIQVATKAKVRN